MGLRNQPFSICCWGAALVISFSLHITSQNFYCMQCTNNSLWLNLSQDVVASPLVPLTAYLSWRQHWCCKQQFSGLPSLVLVLTIFFWLFKVIFTFLCKPNYLTCDTEPTWEPVGLRFDSLDQDKLFNCEAFRETCMGCLCSFVLLSGWKQFSLLNSHVWQKVFPYTVKKNNRSCPLILTRFSLALASTNVLEMWKVHLAVLAYGTSC